MSASRAGYQEGIVSAVANTALAALKFWAGTACGSVAIVADAWHTLSDTFSSVIVIISVRLSAMRPDAQHPFGYGRWEQIAALFIGCLLGVVAYDFATESIERLTTRTTTNFGTLAIVVTIVSILAKEVLAQYAFYLARRSGNDAVKADGWHHRSDALSSVGTALGIGGAVVLGPRWAVLDPLAAIVVSALIVHVAYKLLLPCVGELLEQSLPEAEEQYIRQVILSHPGVSDPHNLRTRRIGDYRAIEVHFRMDGNTTIHEAHAATRAIEDALREKFGRQTIINTHVEPVK